MFSPMKLTNSSAPHANGARICVTHFGIVPPSPDRDLALQLDVEAFLDAAAHQVHEAEHVAGAGAGLHHDVVGVAVADLGAADARPRQAGLLDHRRGAEAARVLEDAARRLEAERLRRLALDPRLAHPL